MRSHFGCAVCRSRKVKCDEKRPVCGPCKKAVRNCVFSVEPVFRNGNSQVARRKHNNGAIDHAQDVSVFARDHIWVEIPNNLTFVQVSDPYDVDTPEANLYSAREGNEPPYHPDSITVPISCGHEVLPEPDELATATLGNSCDILTPTSNRSFSNHNAQSIESRVGSDAGASPSRSSIGGNDGTVAELVDEGGDEASHSRVESQISGVDAKILSLILIRHFKEGLGQWMDLFDTSAYFSRRVSMMASTNELLRYSLCAVAAKHIQRVYDLTGNPPPSCKGLAYVTQCGQNFNWKYMSADYYHKAIGSLRVGVSALDFDEDHTYSSTPPEDIFAAVAILCMYELIDAPGTAWKAHLCALPLCIPNNNSSMFEFSTARIPHTGIKSPVFWSLARQDILCACIGETQTRLKLEDMMFWYQAGFATRGSSFQFPWAYTENQGPSDVEEDLKSNQLICISSKVVNFITSGDALDPNDYARPPGQRFTIGVAQEVLRARWNAIECELQQWYSSLPSTFIPIARTRAATDNIQSNSNDFGDFQQIWFDIPACAATMQSYHMARILLHANRPQESTAIRSTVSARLQGYRYDEQQIIHHARQICGISIADPPDAVRVHSVQPLYVAGQVFHREEDQQMVIRLLADIEKEIGWSTTYYIQKLKDEYQASTTRLIIDNDT
ncbi:hypothetical protein F5B20DRAFT_541941 [Whalleya microplaca]|nr:hypothetical protein F5B20DRAFT_541941 [Whalleya microplaca]